MMKRIGFVPEPMTDGRLAWNQRNGSTNDRLLHVAIKINDLEAWKQLNVPGSITTLSTHEWMITAQISSSKLLSITGLPFVISVQHGTGVGPGDQK
jgi:hypothetical protein